MSDEVTEDMRSIKPTTKVKFQGCCGARGNVCKDAVGNGKRVWKKPRQHHYYEALKCGNVRGMNYVAVESPGDCGAGKDVIKLIASAAVEMNTYLRTQRSSNNK